MKPNFISKYRNSILWAIVITILCLSPSSGYPKVSIPHLDKLVHFGLYSVFATLLISESNPLRTMGDVTLRAKLCGLIVSIALGGIIEFIQGTQLIARSCSLADFCANTAGALTAMITYKQLNNWLKGLI